MRSLDLRSEVAWRGAVEVVELGGTITPWRLPPARRDCFDAGDLLRRARIPSGVRLALRTDSRSLALDLDADPEAAPVDLVVGDAVVRRAARDRTAVELPGREGEVREVEIWLPHMGEARVRSLAVDDDASCHPAPAEGPRWVVHGSSITQGRGADGPTGTWPARCTRALGYDLLNLGFGGEACLDPMLARLIRDEPADLVTLCLGINVHGAATHSRRSLRAAVLGFLATVCDGHPDVPVQVISPLPTLRPADETNLHGLTLGEVRDAVEPSVQILRADGATQLELVPGPAIFDPTEPGVMHDRIHSSEVGYARIAERMTPYLSAAKEA